MDNLSWIMYFAGVSENITSSVSFILIIVVVFGWIPFAAKEEFKVTDLALDNLIRFYKIFAVLAVLSLFIPSKDALHKIAENEFGAVALKNHKPSNNETWPDWKEKTNK